MADDQVTFAAADAEVLTKGMKLLQTLNGHPEARRHLETALKVVDPKIKTTEEQAREIFDPVVSGLKAELDELKAARAKDDEARRASDDAAALARLDTQFAAIRQDGATDEGIEATKKLMVEKSIADPLAAWALFQKQNPTVEVSSASYEPNHWNFEQNAVETDVEGLWKDPDKWADQEAGRILTDLRKAPGQG